MKKLFICVIIVLTILAVVLIVVLANKQSYSGPISAPLDDTNCCTHMGYAPLPGPSGKKQPACELKYPCNTPVKPVGPLKPVFPGQLDSFVAGTSRGTPAPTPIPLNTYVYVDFTMDTSSTPSKDKTWYRINNNDNCIGVPTIPPRPGRTATTTVIEIVKGGVAGSCPRVPTDPRPPPDVSNIPCKTYIIKNSRTNFQFGCNPSANSSVLGYGNCILGVGCQVVWEKPPAQIKWTLTPVDGKFNASDNIYYFVEYFLSADFFDPTIGAGQKYVTLSTSSAKCACRAYLKDKSKTCPPQGNRIGDGCLVFTNSQNGSKHFPNAARVRFSPPV